MRSRAALFALLSFLLIAFVTAHADQLESDKIEILKDRLSDERIRLDSLSNVKKSELQQLNSLNQQLDLTNELLGRLKGRISRLNREKKELEGEIGVLDSVLSRQKTRLAAVLRNFYLKRRRLSQVVLSSQDLNHAFGQIVYSRKTFESLKGLATETDSMLTELHAKTVRLDSTSSEISYYYKEQEREKGLIKSQYDRRNKLMDRIRQEENLYRDHLTQLKSDIRAADTLFSEPQGAVDVSVFESMKGLLEYPVKGKVVKTFGMYTDKKTNTEIFHPGIDIMASAGAEVRCVYDGRVYHKGRLRGYGNVLIIDHGGGWYSLYSNLGEYSVEMGSGVSTGDVIGALGSESTSEAPTLHFQIRHRKEQLDPVEWLAHP